MGYYSYRSYWYRERPKMLETADGVYLIPIHDRYHSSEVEWGKQAYVYAADGTDIFVEEALNLVEILRIDQEALRKAGVSVKYWTALPDPNAPNHTADSGLWWTIGRGTLGSGVQELFQNGRGFSSLRKETTLKGGRLESITVAGPYHTRAAHETWVEYVRGPNQDMFWKTLDSLRKYTHDLAIVNEMYWNGSKYAKI